MGIEIGREQLLTLRQAARLYPLGADGRPTHSGTVARHCLTGLLDRDGQRTYLEHIKAGGRLCTSVEAVQRFFTRLGGRTIGDLPRTPVQTRSDHATAEAALTAAGF